MIPLNLVTIPENNKIRLIAESLVRAVRLERLGAPARILEKEYTLIRKRLASVTSRADLQRIPFEVEEVLKRRISSSFASASCINCSGIVDCPRIKDPADDNACFDTLPGPFPFEPDTVNLCRDYRPNWDQFDEAGKLYPDLVNRLQTSFTVSVNRGSIARHLVSVMGLWARQVSNRN